MNNKFDPRGIVFQGHPDIKEATSITDYIFNYLEKKSPGYKSKESKEDEKINSDEDERIDKKKNKKKSKKKNSGIPGGFCPECGGQMYKEGHCNEVCGTCNFIDPKGCGQ